MLRGLWAQVIRLVLVTALVILAATCMAFSVRYQGIAALVLMFLAWRHFNTWRASGAYGRAQFESVASLLRAGMLSNDGLILGRVGYCLLPSKWAAWRFLISPTVNAELACRMFLAVHFTSRWINRRFIRVRRFVHLSTFAPTGRGKSTGVLIPNLLSYRGSCVVFDQKGELYKASAEHRRRTFKHRIIRLDPFGVCGPGADTLNPLDFMEADDADLIEKCRDLANQLVVRTGMEKDPYWNDQAEAVISTFVYLIATCEDRPTHRHLHTFRDLISSRHNYGVAIRKMREDPEGEIMKRLGGLASWLRNKELSSVMASVQRHTQWMESEILPASMSKQSTFDPRILRGRATVYLILPSELLTVYQGLIRMWLGTLLRVITRRGADESNPVLFLIDEAATLGHMKVLHDAVTLMRGMGIRLWFFWQSIDQMKQCFGEQANVVLGNMDTQQYFGIADYETAAALSKRMGDSTIRVTSFNRTWGRSQSKGVGRDAGGNVSNSTSVTSSEIARPLYRPEEILTVDDNVCWIFHRNMNVMPGTLVYHFADPEFRPGRAGRQKGLGLVALPLALCTLVFSLFVAGFASMPMPVRQRQVVMTPEIPWGRLQGVVANAWRQWLPALPFFGSGSDKEDPSAPRPVWRPPGNPYAITSRQQVPDRVPARSPYAVGSTSQGHASRSLIRIP